MAVLLFDSSVYISVLNPKDIFYHQTQKFTLELRKKSGVEIIIPALVLLEVANISKRSVEQILFLFKDSLLIDLDLSLSREIIPIFKKVNLKTSDAIITAIAKIYKAELISWDKKLLKEAKKLTKAFTPLEYLRKEYTN